MAATVKFLSREQWDVIAPLLEPGLVLIPPLVSALLPEGAKELDGVTIDYDFGGEADCWIDVVHWGGHPAIRSITETLKEMS